MAVIKFTSVIFGNVAPIQQQDTSILLGQYSGHYDAVYPANTIQISDGAQCPERAVGGYLASMRSLDNLEHLPAEMALSAIK
jgi:hypothetical protein